MTATRWNATKRRQLAKFMHAWQQRMGQTYVGTYDGERSDHYGFVFPKAIKSGQLDGRLVWVNQRIRFRWSEDGEQSAPFQVVEAATMDNQHGFLTTYFFCLHNQRPVVFVTGTTNGDDLYVSDSQNSELQAGFAKIVTGKAQTIASDQDLNADNAAAIAAKPQRIPRAYQGTWYWYDSQQKVVRKFTAGTSKATHIFDDHAAGIHIEGALKHIGTGGHERLRYKYYDGQQIPVMEMGDGPHVWYKANAYRERAVATNLQTYQFGDELHNN
ncbi:DUF4767 domain-containing protein [Lactiplantibacillus plajomi]|uniref:DUF4767 domain-containing protein n=1 Tax=Lactiplantibacillus plajomi TaxID=1457217 RepID=UPI001CDC72DA|nr:DUF4767 domain-containing protein [Lactiplantibacillus plajomi]